MNQSYYLVVFKEGRKINCQRYFTYSQESAYREFTREYMPCNYQRQSKQYNIKVLEITDVENSEDVNNVMSRYNK